MAPFKTHLMALVLAMPLSLAAAATPSFASNVDVDVTNFGDGNVEVNVSVIGPTTPEAACVIDSQKVSGEWWLVHRLITSDRGGDFEFSMRVNWMLNGVRIRSDQPKATLVSMAPNSSHIVSRVRYGQAKGFQSKSWLNGKLLICSLL